MIGKIKTYSNCFLLSFLCCLFSQKVVAQFGQEVRTFTKEEILDFIQKNEFEQADTAIQVYIGGSNQIKNKALIKDAFLFAQSLRAHAQFSSVETVLNRIRPFLSEKSDLLHFYYTMYKNNKESGFLLRSAPFLDTAKTICLALGDSLSYFRIITSEAILLSDMNLIKRSNESAQNPLSYFRRLNYQEDLNRIYTLLAYNFGVQRNFSQALSYLKNSYDLDTTAVSLRARYLNALNIGYQMAELDRVKEAEFYFKEAAHLAIRKKSPHEEVLVYRHLANLKLKSQELDEAWNYLNKATKVITTLKQDEELYKIKQSMLMLAVYKRDFKEALTIMNTLDSVNTDNANDKLTISESVRVETLIENGFLKEAQENIDTGFNDPENLENPFLKAILETYLMSLKDVDKAIQNVTKIVDIFNEQRQIKINSSYYRALFTKKSINQLKRLTGKITEKKLDSSFLFNINELVKGRITSERFDFSEQQKYDLANEDKLLKMQNLKEAIAIAQLEKGKNLDEKILTLQRELDALDINLKSNETDFQNEQWKLPQLTELQQKLPNKAAFIHFLDTPNGLTLLLITNNASHALIRTNQNEIVTLTNRMSAQLVEKEKKWNFELSDSLYQAIFGTLSDTLLQYSNVIISPDSYLSALPFSALSFKKSFLAEKMAVRYISSFYMAGNLIKAQPFYWTSDVFAIAAPNYPEKQKWSDLPFTKLEVLNIEDKGFSVTKLFGKEASVSNFFKKSKVNQFRYYHIATHGVTESVPDQSRLLFSYENNDWDGLLFPFKLQKNSLKSDLVVLSACETAAGTNISGEGIWGMQRAWFLAGSQTVIASSWNVNDKSSALFMNSFYEALSSNDSYYTQAKLILKADLSLNPKISSLQKAQKEMIQSIRYEHPYYWAAYYYNGL